MNKDKKKYVINLLIEIKFSLNNKFKKLLDKSFQKLNTYNTFKVLNLFKK